MVSVGAILFKLSLLSLLLIGGIITPTLSSLTVDLPVDYESILHSLRFQGMTASADALDNVIWNHAFMVPANTTLFFPMNDAMAPVATLLNVTELIHLLSYHIVTDSLPVEKFTQLPVGTMLKTMVANASLVVTENTKTLMTINNQEVMPRDLCTNVTVTCYAMKEVLLLETREKSFDVSTAALGEAPILPPSGAPVVLPVDSPLGAPVPVRAPIISPPPKSLGMVPVPTSTPAIIILPPPRSPGGAPMLSPGEAPEGALSTAMMTKVSTVPAIVAAVVASNYAAPSTAMTMTASMATLVAVVVLTILVL